MHYVEYIPGTVSRITNFPAKHGNQDVNLLSRYVSEFNSANASHFEKNKNARLNNFEQKFKRFLLS
jgi:hypothetical protein